MTQHAGALPPRDDGIPLYVRLASSMRSRITKGEWSVGERIPAFEELATAYGVAMNTVRKAVELLANEGLVASGRGRGTVVASQEVRPLEGALMQELHNPLSVSRELEIKLIKMESGVSLPAGLLKAYNPSDSYVRVVKTHAVRGLPYGYLDIYVEQEAFNRFPRDAVLQRKVTRLLRDFGGNEVLNTRQQLTIGYADDTLAKMLNCPPASALVRVRRWKIAAQERLVLACEIFYRGDTFIWDSTESEANEQAIVPDGPNED